MSLYIGNIDINDPRQGVNEINDGYVGIKQFFHREKGLWYADFAKVGSQFPYFHSLVGNGIILLPLATNEIQVTFKNEDYTYIRIEFNMGNGAIQWILGSTSSGSPGSVVQVYKLNGKLQAWTFDLPNGFIGKWVTVNFKIKRTTSDVSAIEIAKVDGVECVNKLYSDNFYDTFSTSTGEIIMGIDEASFQGEPGKLASIKYIMSNGTGYGLNFENYNLTWSKINAVFTPINATKEQMIKHIE